MTLNLRITFDHAFATRQPSPLEIKPYATIRNGDNKVSTKTAQGNKPEWKQQHVLTVDKVNPILKIKIKDRNTNMAFISYANVVVGEAEINLNDTRVFEGEKVEGYYSLMFQKHPAGKIYLKIEQDKENPE